LPTSSPILFAEKTVWTAMRSNCIFKSLACLVPCGVIKVAGALRVVRQFHFAQFSDGRFALFRLSLHSEGIANFDNRKPDFVRNAVENS
jgi:hypothetical protein